jgi:hypothetical protein
MSIHNRLGRLERDRRMCRLGSEPIRPSPSPVRLKTAADLLPLLEVQIAAVLGAPEVSTLDRARVIGFLTGIALKAFDAGNLQARLAMLEAVLKQREGNRKP